MSDETLEVLLAKLQELFSEQFARGEKAATARILDVVQGKQSRKSQAGTLGEERSRGTKKRLRAPKGAPRAFVERALSKAGPSGISAQNILNAANSEVERSVSLSGIRLELSRGETEGRYRSDKGKWFISRAGRTAA